MHVDIYLFYSDCNGKGKSIDMKLRCKDCKGTKVQKEKKIVEVYIEPGMKNKQRIVMRGLGDEAPGMEAGDM